MFSKVFFAFVEQRAGRTNRERGCAASQPSSRDGEVVQASHAKWTVVTRPDRIDTICRFAGCARLRLRLQTSKIPTAME
jgi:hypothetical protein